MNLLILILPIALLLITAAAAAATEKEYDNPWLDPDCWYGDLYVCNEKGECDSENFDCLTECADGSDVTTGEECPGKDSSDAPNEEQDERDEELTPEQIMGCQKEDDYCDFDENCQLTTIDCIDDRGFDQDDYNG
jgi:hypothetical protein